ncbi:hypothetical protein SKAU_G00239680 [Synaphobranchus kaupii]|uniref:Uncharacterized protein n=1 Tax=Synaphobranchus kaupii TaxID=118154 RepID=A0A9Q1F776_SYNKA|nr:hypothetical protein SKAU_G00239680 [Synaphobranchus kaupii]
MYCRTRTDKHRGRLRETVGTEVCLILLLKATGDRIEEKLSCCEEPRPETNRVKQGFVREERCPTTHPLAEANIART